VWKDWSADKKLKVIVQLVVQVVVVVVIVVGVVEHSDNRIILHT